MPEKFDGYIDKIRINGKTYAIKAQITEIHPMTCPKCGSPLELHYGEGKCDYCGTSYTSRFVVEEK
jgi:hypothetical protein